MAKEQPDLTASNSDVTKIADLVKPTRQRIDRAKTAAVINGDGDVLVAANDNFVQNADRAYVMQDAPISRLLKSGRISSVQHEAGVRFFSDWYAAGLAPLGAQDYGRPVVDGRSPASESDYRVGALGRYNKACAALPHFLLLVVDSVVLLEIQIETVGRGLGLNNAAQARAVATDRLCLGLDALASHYRLT